MSSIPRMKMIICRHPHLLHDDAVVVIYRSKPRRRSPFSCWSEKEKRQGEVVIIIPPWKPAALLQFRCLLQNESQHHHLTSPLHFSRKVGAGGNVITFTKEMFPWKEKQGNNTKNGKVLLCCCFFGMLCMLLTSSPTSIVHTLEKRRYMEGKRNCCYCMLQNWIYVLQVASWRKNMEDSSDSFYACPCCITYFGGWCWSPNWKSFPGDNHLHC